MSDEIHDWESDGAGEKPAAPAAVVATAVVPVVESEAQAAEPEPESDAPEPADSPAARHRARKQAARAEDVPRIRELTGKWRQAERERDELRQELERSKVAPAPAVVAPVQNAPVAQAEAFSEKEPALEDFVGKSDDPYLAHARALAAYDRRKDAFTEKQAERTAEQQRQTAQANARQTVIEEQFASRVQKFATERPKDFERLKTLTLTPVMAAAVKLSDTAEIDLLHHLDSSGSLLEDLGLMTEGKPVTDHLVALVQRRLKTRTPAATTGSATFVPPSPAPRPPNPVRTGPMKTDDALPGDDDSIEAHERAFGSRTRRR